MRVKIFRNIVDILSGKLTSDNMRLRDYQIEKRSSEDSIALLERELEAEEQRLAFAMESALSAGDISADEIELYLDEKLKSLVHSVLVVDDEPEIRILLKKNPLCLCCAGGGKWLSSSQYRPGRIAGPGDYRYPHVGYGRL